MLSANIYGAGFPSVKNALFYAFIVAFHFCKLGFCILPSGITVGRAIFGNGGYSAGSYKMANLFFGGVKQGADNRNIAAA